MWPTASRTEPFKCGRVTIVRGGTSCTSPSPTIPPRRGPRNSSAKRSLGPSASIPGPRLRSCVRRIAGHRNGNGDSGSAYGAALTLENAYAERSSDPRDARVSRSRDHIQRHGTPAADEAVFAPPTNNHELTCRRNKDAPIHRPIAARGDGRVVAIPQVGDCITSTNAKRPDRVCSSHSHQPESVLAETANDRDRDRRRRSPFRKDN